MGRGSSKVGGGGGAKTASGKPFKQNDWKTWPVGTKVVFTDDGDIVESQNDSDGFKVVGGKAHSGTVTQVFSDHLIVDVPDISDHMWLDNVNNDMFRARKKRG